MAQTFPFSTRDLLYIALVAIPYLLCVFSPVIYSSFVLFRHKPALPRKRLFMFTVTSFTYGFFVFLFLALLIPAQFYLVYIAPSLKNAGYYYCQPLVTAADFVSEYFPILIGIALVSSAILITRRLQRIWPAIVEATRV